MNDWKRLRGPAIALKSLAILSAYAPLTITAGYFSECRLPSRNFERRTKKAAGPKPRRRILLAMLSAN
jgi:hypothetical protein